MGLKRKTDSEIKEILDKYNLTWIDGVYKGLPKRTITCIDKEGYKHLVSITNLIGGHPPRYVDKANPYTLENINLWLSKQDKFKGHKVLSKEYIKTESLLDFITEEGYKYQTKWNIISTTTNIGIFETSNDYVMDNIRLWLKLNKPHLAVVSDKYNNTREDMIFKCECGRIINKSFMLIKEPHTNSCECRTNADKYISPSWKLIEDKKEEYLKINVIVYIIRCYNDDEVFYKIGYTRNGLKRRFKDRLSMPYRYDVVNIIETNLYDAIKEERRLHIVNDKYSYKPLICFNGDTECFNELDDIGV